MDRPPFFRAQSGYAAYRQVLADLEREFVADELKFGSDACRQIADDLERRAVELRAQARDWVTRADTTGRKSQ
jgi:hypothetical protein